MDHKYTNNVKQYYWSHQDLLGQGGFGKVFKGHDMSKKGTPDEICAVKLMDCKQIHENPILTELFKNEQNALLTLKGDHVVNARDIFEQAPYTYVIGPLCNGGDLRKYLTKKGGRPLPEHEALHIFRDMLKGMKQMVDNNLVHRDLKPENTFIHDNKYKIADFGFVQTAKPGQEMDFQGGTPGYMNPQIVMNMPYTNKCDVWTMAIIYYEMLFGNIPGRGRDDNSRIRELQRTGVQFPSQIQISKQSKEFLKGCLQVNEARRWSWEQVFSSPIFASEEAYKPQSTERKGELAENDKVFIKSLREYIISQGDDLRNTLTRFFPNPEFNKQQFEQFCSYSKVEKNSVDRIFVYLDKDGSGTVTIEEFQDQILDADFEKPEEIKLLKGYCMRKSISIQTLYHSVNGNAPEMDSKVFAKIIRYMDKEITDHELDFLFKAFDADGSGQISYPEFAKAFEDKNNHSTSHILKKDKSQMSDVAYQQCLRMKKIMHNYDLDLVKLFEHFEMNNDSKINLEEFTALVLDIDRYCEEDVIEELFKSIAGPDQMLQLQEFANIF